MNVLRRISLSRLALLCGLVVGVGISATALASALGSSPSPPPKPLAQALHDALAAPAVEGVSANVTLTNHLLEGAGLASGGSSQAAAISSNPLLAGGSGRLWIARDGRVRLELQAEQGDTQVIYDGHTLTVYDASSNTVYRYTPPAGETTEPPATSPRHGEAPSVAKVEEAITHLRAHMDVSEATPTDVAGRPAYTVRVAPKEGGSLIGGAELSFDAAYGVPLRAAIYSTGNPSPVVELAATEVSYGPIEESVFAITPPASAKVEDLSASSGANPQQPSPAGAGTTRPKLTTLGSGITAIAVLEAKAGSTGKQGEGGSLEDLPKVSINGTSASELRTALGTILTFERSGVRYVLAGSVPPAAVEAQARGL